MKYHELTLRKNKSARRVGRGIAAGQGKTAGRGTKGQMARTGSSRRPGFEGGQTPIMQQLPKLRGFHSHRSLVSIVYTNQLNKLGTSNVDAQVLASHGLIPSAYHHVKLITKGELTKKVTVSLPAASASAIAQIEKAGGSFKSTPRLAHPKTKADKKAS